jgi:hypothetical protein
VVFCSDLTLQGVNLVSDFAKSLFYMARTSGQNLVHGLKALGHFLGSQSRFLHSAKGQLHAKPSPNPKTRNPLIFLKRDLLVKTSSKRPAIIFFIFLEKVELRFENVSETHYSQSLKPNGPHPVIWAK